MFRKTFPDDQSGSAETSLAEFRSCSWHGHISTFCRMETGSAREICHLYADVLEICRTGTSDTVKCKEFNLNPFAPEFP